MRILQLIQKKQLRGAEVFACQLSNQLIAMGHHVKMVALLDGDVSMPFLGEVEVLKINHGSRLFDWKGWRNLSSIIDEFKPDIVQANAGDTLKYAAISKKLFGWKAKLVFRNANKMGDFVNTKWKWYFNHWLIREVDAVASVSDECRTDFIRCFRWPESTITTLPIGVERAANADHNPYAENAFQNRSPFLLHVGGFVPEKNHIGLLRIVDELRQSYPGVVLVMIGEGKLRTSIADVAKTMGLNDHVWFVGRRHDVNAFMQHADALLMPSLIEGLPGVILEAFVNKLPVVAYNVGGIKEVIHPGKTGWLVEKNDEKSFVESLTALLELDAAKLNNMIEQAYDEVISRYQNNVIAAKFEQHYLNITGQLQAATQQLS